MDTFTSPAPIPERQVSQLGLTAQEAGARLAADELNELATAKRRSGTRAGLCHTGFWRRCADPDRSVKLQLCLVSATAAQQGVGCRVAGGGGAARVDVFLGTCA